MESIPGGSENALQTALASQLKELMSMTTKSTMTLAAASPPHFRSAATLAAAAEAAAAQAAAAEVGAAPHPGWRTRGVLYLADMRIVSIRGSNVPIITFKVGTLSFPPFPLRLVKLKKTRSNTKQ